MPAAPDAGHRTRITVPLLKAEVEYLEHHLIGNAVVVPIEDGEVGDTLEHGINSAEVSVAGSDADLSIECAAGVSLARWVERTTDIHDGSASSLYLTNAATKIRHAATTAGYVIDDTIPLDEHLQQS